VPGRIKAVAQMNYQLKNYDKAIEYGNRAIKGGFADDEMKTLVGQSYYLKGDYKGTLKFYDEMVSSQIKNGQTPKDEALQLALSACVKLNDTSARRRSSSGWLSTTRSPSTGRTCCTRCAAFRTSATRTRCRSIG